MEMKEIREMASKIRVKKKIMKVDQALDGKQNQQLPRTSVAAKRSRSVARLKGEFTELGVDMSNTEGANFTKTRGRSKSKSAAKRSKMMTWTTAKTVLWHRHPRPVAAA